VIAPDAELIPLDAPVRPRHEGRWMAALRRLRHSPSALVGAVLVAVLVLAGVFGPAVAPWDYRVMDLDAVLANDAQPLPLLAPNHPLGTDRIGRDQLSRILDGARVSLTVAVVAQLMVLLIGVPIGAIAGWRGGRTEAILMRFTDVIYGFPDLLFVIVVSGALVNTPYFRILDGLLVVFVAIGLVSWVNMARLVRGMVLALKHTEYVDAARALGVPGHAILRRHVLPNAIGPIVVMVSIGLPGAILAESTLSFLGLGVQSPRASWGSLIADAVFHEAQRAPWLVFTPMVALGLALIGFTLLGDGLRDALDPRRSRRA
jgi:oligopeptide transport system permease protein